MIREIDRRLFEPSGIAVVGATPDLARIGGQPIRALTQFAYRRCIYPVNPRHAAIAGLRTYARATDIDGPCDLALVAVPAAQVPDVEISVAHGVGGFFRAAATLVLAKS